MEDLKKAFKDTARQVDLLCDGFNVRMEPQWSKLSAKILQEVKEWQKGKPLRDALKIEPPFLFYPAYISKAVTATLPEKILKQFHDKFLDIIKTSLMPDLKKYKKENPDLDVNIFRPLLTVKLASKASIVAKIEKHYK